MIYDQNWKALKKTPLSYFLQRSYLGNAGIVCDLIQPQKEAAKLEGSGAHS